ncbi:hypothetical protein BpHYR1_005727 [Brachionus plicatilis]|uniref:Uncharacterized protein n=1 Tax=Brachionus plicatilis TaxID=10195 RepID=A0A3M7S1K9_BRAPC|nr:hypothetical protein BpHYR1_005727 [Brachionus plicatilis]
MHLLNFGVMIRNILSEKLNKLWLEKLEKLIKNLHIESCNKILIQFCENVIWKIIKLKDI